MRTGRARTCTYLVPLEVSATDAELQILASYLSTLSLAGCDVVVLDPAAGAVFDQHRRILRWVSRHVACDADVLQTAVDLATSENIIIAAPESRYTTTELTSVCRLLEQSEAVEPEEFVHPLPWWGAVDAGRILLQRGLDQPGGTSRTFAFRRSVWRPVRGLEERHRDHHLNRLKTHGTEVYLARDVFVRREPPRLPVWARLRALEASTRPAMPLQAVLACLLPMLIVLSVIGGFALAGGYAGIIALAAVLVAVRGRSGAGKFFPLHTCLFAPLAIIERSLTVYWTLFARLRDEGLRRQASGLRRPSPDGDFLTFGSPKA